MVEGVVQGTLKLTIVAAKNVSSGGRDPSTLVRMRILNSPPGDPKGKPVASQLQSSEVTALATKTRDPIFNQDFKFDIKDAKNARLDVTLWDSEISITESPGFLGEVLLNVGKLIAYSGTGIQQTFTVRAAPDKDGNVTEVGQIVMILLYENEASSPSTGPAAKHDAIVGVTVKLPQPWKLVKPKRTQYEAEVLEALIMTLGSDGNESRIETVGSERYKNKQGIEQGYMVHFNIHPAKSAHETTAMELAKHFKHCAQDPSGLNRNGSATQHNLGVDIHKPFKKLEQGVQGVGGPKKTGERDAPKTSGRTTPVRPSLRQIAATNTANAASPSMSLQTLPPMSVNIKVVSITDFKAHSILTKTDPFVELELGKIKFQTSTKSNAGGTAVFNESKIFTLPTNSSTLLNVRVWDSNTFSNENLGEAQIDVTTVSSSSVEIETFKKGKPSGKVTLELEMKPLSASEEAFAALDRDNSGGVSLEELSTAMKRQNPSVTQSEVNARFNSLDKNHDGTISRAEFKQAMDEEEDEAPELRGICPVCGEGVYTNQDRCKEDDDYYHEQCWEAAKPEVRAAREVELTTSTAAPASSLPKPSLTLKKKEMPAKEADSDSSSEEEAEEYSYMDDEEMIFGDDDPVTLEEVEDKMETAGVAHSAMMEAFAKFDMQHMNLSQVQYAPVQAFHRPQNMVFAHGQHHSQPVQHQSTTQPFAHAGSSRYYSDQF